MGDKCNNACPVCGFLERKCPPKSLQEIELELQKINKQVYKELLLTGGEVLLRKDIFEIIRLVRAYGFRVWIESNARVLAYPPLVEELKKFSIAGFFIEFYSHDPVVHNFAANAREAFTESVAGIKQLIAAGFTPIVRLLILRENYKGLAQTIEFLSNIGVKKIQLHFPESVPEKYSQLEKLVPKIPEAVPSVNLALAKMAELGLEFVPGFTPFSPFMGRSEWVKHGKKTGKPERYELLYDNGKNINRKPLISVVIPTFNRAAILINTLTGLLNQTLPAYHFEVIVVDDGSTDDTLERVKKFKAPFRLRYYIQDDLGYGPGRARNLGTLLAEGEIMLFLDSDVISSPTNLEEHARTHAEYKRLYNHDVLVIGKRLDILPSSLAQQTLTPRNVRGNFEAIQRLPARPDLREDFYKWCSDNPSEFHSPWHMVYTNNISVRREHMIKAGLIDESFVFWSIEDQELGYRLQWLRFVLNSMAVGYHQPHPVVYSSKEGMDKSIKYNARIFYKKYLNPKIYEVYKPWIHNATCTVQLNDATLSSPKFYRFIGREPGKEKPLEIAMEELRLYEGEGDTALRLIGGNPLLYPGIEKLLSFASPRFGRIEVDTEAESIQSLGELLKWSRKGVNHFIINLAGLSEQQHDPLFKKGSYAAAIKAIKNLRGLNQSFTVRLIISKLSHPHLEEIIDLLNRLGVRNVEFNMPLSIEPDTLLFDEPSIPAFGLLYYNIFRGMKRAKELGMHVTSVNVFSEFMGLGMNIMLRMYELFGKPVAISRGELR